MVWIIKVKIMRGSTYSAPSKRWARRCLIRATLTPSHVHLMPINNTGRCLWQQSILLTRFGQPSRTGCLFWRMLTEIRRAMATTTALLSVVTDPYFSIFSLWPGRTAVATGRARRGKVPTGKTNALTSTRADLGCSRSSRECSGVTSPHVCSGAAGRVTMRWWRLQMWETFLPAHVVGQNASVSERTWPGSNTRAARDRMKTHQKEWGARGQLSCRQRVSLRAALRVRARRKGGWGVDSIVFAAGDVILNQWRVTRDEGLRREHVCTCTLKELEDGARGGGRGGRGRWG